MCGGGFCGGPAIVLFPMLAVGLVGDVLGEAKKEADGKIKQQMSSIHRLLNPTFLKIQQDKLTAKIQIGKYALPNAKIANLYYRRGICCFLCRMYQKASQDFEKSFKKHSHFLHAYMCGNVHQMIGNYEIALSWFNEALKLYDSYEEQMKNEGLDAMLSNWFRDARDNLNIGGTKLRNNVSSLMSIFSTNMSEESREIQKSDEDQILLFGKWKLSEKNITKSDVYTCRAMCNMSPSINDLNSAISDLDEALNNYKEKKHKELVLVNMKASYAHNLALSYLYARSTTQAKKYIDLSVSYLDETGSSSQGQSHHEMELICRVKKLQCFIYQVSEEPSQVIEKTKNDANEILSLLKKDVKVEECFYYRLLPTELFLKILEFVSRSTLGKIMQCDRSLHKLCLSSLQIQKDIQSKDAF